MTKGSKEDQFSLVKIYYFAKIYKQSTLWA